MTQGVFFVAVLLFLIVPMALIIVALVDLAKRDAANWDAAGQNQIVWVLIIVLVGVVGPILYLAIAKPKLEAARPLG